MPKLNEYIDLSGRRFGKWTVIDFVERRKYAILWRCRCDCGEDGSVYASALKSGASTSCGCGRNASVIAMCTTHNQSRTPTYNVWCCMKARCTNPNNPSFKRYGGRGIKISGSWSFSFENFLFDMGEKPAGLTLERKNNDQGYCKENCEWASMTTQSRNRRGNRFLTAFGETKTIAEWAAVSGIKQGTISMRLVYGWSHEKAVSENTHGRK